MFNYPETQQKYQTFFRNHTDLYDGYRSAAQVALAYLFDQTYFLNIEHFRQVHALSRYLADQQIPFDIVIEDDLVPGGLDRYRAVILPNTVFLEDRELAAVEAFVRSGGTLVLIGEVGTYDRYCRERDKVELAERFKNTKGRVIRFNSISEVLPHPGLFLEPALQTAESFELMGEKSAGKYVNLAAMDNKLWFKRYQDAGPLTPIIAEALGRNPRLLDPWDASGVRNTVYVRKINKGEQMVIHLVNKNVPLAVPLEERELKPVRNLKIHAPLPLGSRVSTVRCFEVGEKERVLSWDAEPAGGITIPLDLLNAYAVISIEYQPG
ncbi:MAG: beta-galactosidase trimerization domain-containing protein, partial [bacterium]